MRDVAVGSEDDRTLATRAAVGPGPGGCGCGDLARDRVRETTLRRRRSQEGDDPDKAGDTNRRMFHARIVADHVARSRP